MDISRARLVTPVVNGVQHAWLRVPITGEWLAEYRLALQDERIIVAAVRVFPTAWLEGLPPLDKTAQSEERAGLQATVPAGGIRRAVLKRLKVGAVVEASDEMFGALRKMLGGQALSRVLEGPVREADGSLVPPPLPLSQLGALAPMFDALLSKPWGARPSATRRPDAKRPGRRPLADEVLLKAAEVYARAWETWKRGGPAPQPSAARALKMTEARMRDLVYRARRRGFLPKTSQGLGGGQLTPEGRALLVKLRRRQTRRRRPR
jgi:hypothetical protein